MQPGTYMLEFEYAQRSHIHGPFVFLTKEDLLNEVKEFRAGLGYVLHTVVVHQVTKSFSLEDL